MQLCFLTNMCLFNHSTMLKIQATTNTPCLLGSTHSVSSNIEVMQRIIHSITMCKTSLLSVTICYVKISSSIVQKHSYVILTRGVTNWYCKPNSIIFCDIVESLRNVNIKVGWMWTLTLMDAVYSIQTLNLVNFEFSKLWTLNFESLQFLLKYKWVDTA